MDFFITFQISVSNRSGVSAPVYVLDTWSDSALSLGSFAYSWASFSSAASFA